jgi:formiminotetrahydrofolate cyclodeaminase
MRSGQVDARARQQADQLADLSVGRFIGDLSTSAPTPGGGAAAAVVGAIAAGLVSMVAELSANRPKLQPYAATVHRSAVVGRRMGLEMLRLADQDAVAFEAFMDAWRRSREMAPDERRVALSAAARASAEAPRLILSCCVVIADACRRLAGRSNRNLDSDLVCASRAVEAAAHCAAENVRVNLSKIADLADAAALREETRRREAGVERDARACRRAIASPRPRGPERPQAIPNDDTSWSHA